MKRNNSLIALSLALIALFISSGLNFPEAMATYQTIHWTDFTPDKYARPQICIANSTKYIAIAQIENAGQGNNDINIRVYNMTSGALVYNERLMAISISTTGAISIEYDYYSDSFYVMVISRRDNVYSNAYIWIIWTYGSIYASDSSVQLTSIKIPSGTQSLMQCSISKAMRIYDMAFVWVINYIEYGTGKMKLGLIRWEYTSTPQFHDYLLLDVAVGSYIGYVDAFYDGDYGLSFITVDSVSPTQLYPQWYYIINVNSTPSIDEQQSYSNGNDYTLTGNYYLVHSDAWKYIYVYSYLISGVRNYKLVEFNPDDDNYFSTTWTTDNGSGYSGYVAGYYDGDHYNIFYPELSGEPATMKQMKRVYNDDTDIWVLDSTTAGIYFPYGYTTSKIVIDYYATYVFEEDSLGNNSYLYYGLNSFYNSGGAGTPPPSFNYSITFTLNPATSTPTLGLLYTATIRAYANNTAYSSPFNIYDNNVVVTSNNLIGGVASFPITFGSLGEKILTVEIYSANGNYGWLPLYNQTFAFMVVNPPSTPTTPITPITPPSGEQLTTQYINLFTFWLPIAMIVFLPMMALTLAGARYAGGAGAIVGMIFGGATGIIGGTVTGIIPTYALYLLVMLIATAIVMLFVRGSGGNSGGGAP